jgi:hypothetical protein
MLDLFAALDAFCRSIAGVGIWTEESRLSASG